jgi:hypothetical protein
MWVVEELFELHYLESTEYDNNQEIKNDLSSSLYLKKYKAADFIIEKNKYKMPNYPAQIRKDLEIKKSIEEQWIENE